MLKEKLKIDKNDLDEELIQQSQLYYEAGSQYAKAASRSAFLKEQLRKVQSEVDLEIRAQAIEAGDKVTETMVYNKSILDPRYKQAFYEYATSCQEVDEMSALKEAFSQRAYLLKDLVALYLNGYFISNAEKIPVIDNSVKYRQGIHNVRKCLTNERKNHV